VYSTWVGYSSGLLIRRRAMVYYMLSKQSTKDIVWLNRLTSSSRNRVDGDFFSLSLSLWDFEVDEIVEGKRRHSCNIPRKTRLIYSSFSRYCAFLVGKIGCLFWLFFFYFANQL
jgi:hypothetical protein